MSRQSTLARSTELPTRGHADPELRERGYLTPYSDVWAAIERLIAAQRGWEVLDSDANEGVLRAETSGRFLKFPDEIEVTVSLAPSGYTSVLVRSAEIGRTDFGVRRRRLARFWTALEQRLAR